MNADSTRITVGDLLDAALCSGVCLVATSPADGCTCVCGGETHGALIDTEVPVGPIKPREDQRLISDVAALNRLRRPPRSKRDVQLRLGWGSDRANAALRSWRASRKGYASRPDVQVVPAPDPLKPIPRTRRERLTEELREMEAERDSWIKPLMSWYGGAA